VPGTARILTGAPGRASAVGKSPIQPDGGEGCSGGATGYPATDLGRKPSRRGEMPQAHGAMNKNRVRRAWRDEPATQGEVLYPSRSGRYTRRSCAQRCVFTPGDPHGRPIQRYGRDIVAPPGNQAANRENKLRPGAGNGPSREQSRLTAVRKSAEGIVADGKRTAASRRGSGSRRSTPAKARTVPARMDAGK
jgi:hypothetical protein